MRRLTKRLSHFLADSCIRFIAVLAVLSVVGACFPVTQASYSNQQKVTTVTQWMMEFYNEEAKVHLTLRYYNERIGGYGYDHQGFGIGIGLDQLVGLTREQVMSSSGTNVRFHMKRDASGSG